MTTLTVFRGDDKTYPITFSNNSGNAIDITGYTVYFTVKKNVDDSNDDSTALIQKTITSHTDPTNGQTEIVLTDIDTNIGPRSYVYDIQIKDTSSEISTVVSGNFIIKGDVTRRTT